MKSINSDLVSVIVPVYNVEQYLHKCINSIISQTYSNIEIILVDDGSTDACPYICDEYAMKDARIIVIHQANYGISQARNVGIEASKGKWIVFVDSDDYIAIDMVEVLVAYVEYYGADMAICSVNVFSEEKDRILIHEVRTVEFEVSNGYDILKKSKLGNFNYVVAWNKIYNRKLWQNIRYPVGRIHEDAFVIHHLLGLCENVVGVPMILYHYRKNPSSITNSPYSIKRLDDFDALADRAQYYLDNNLEEYVSSVLIYYYERLRLKYYIIEDSEITHNRLVECRKKARRFLYYFLKDRAILFSIRIVTAVFLFCPTIYRIIMHDLLKKL